MSTVLVVLFCGAIIALAIYLFVRNLINISKGKCCEGCDGCSQKCECPNSSSTVKKLDEK